MRAECDAFFGDFAQLVQAENLEAAGIRQDRSRPRHETMQSAEIAHGFDSGAEVKMISVAEKNLNPEFFENILRHTFDCGRRADGHEHGSFDLAVRRDEAAGARRLARGLNAKLNGHLFGIVAMV